MKRIILIGLLIVLMILISGCATIPKEEQIKSCNECGFKNVTDSKACCKGGCITLIECDDDNYIYAFETSNTNVEIDKWGYRKYSGGDTYIVTKCEKFICP